MQRPENFLITSNDAYYQVTEGRRWTEKDMEAEAEGRRVTVVMKVVGPCSAVDVVKVVGHVERQSGVETVAVDAEKDKEITVTGKVEACHLRQMLEKKLRAKVVLFSLVTHDDGGGQGEKRTNAEGISEQEAAKKKSKERSRSELVVLKTRFHCRGCMKKARSELKRSFAGVRAVTVDLEPGLIVIEGWVDVKQIVTYLENLLRQQVQIIQGGRGLSADHSSYVEAPKLQSKGGGEGEGSGNNAKETKERTEEKTRRSMEVAKTKNNKREGEDRGEREPQTPGKQPPPQAMADKEEEVLVSVVVKRRTRQEQDQHQREGSGGGEKGKEEHDGLLHNLRHHQPIENGRPCSYHIEMTHAPQLFSDENPNACSIS